MSNQDFNPNADINPQLMQNLINNPESAVSELFKTPVVVSDENIQEVARELMANHLHMSPEAFIKYVDTSYVHNEQSQVIGLTAIILHTLIWSNANMKQGNLSDKQRHGLLGTFVSETMGILGPIRIMPYEELLNPAAEPMHQKVIHPDVWVWLQTEARRRLLLAASGQENATKEEIALWHKINQGEIPFGYSVAH